MKQEIVLPKFTLPGERPNWLMRAVWAVGGLLVVQMGVLGLVLWKRQSSETDARLAAERTRAAELAHAQTVARAALKVAPPTTTTTTSSSTAAVQPQAAAEKTSMASVAPSETNGVKGAERRGAARKIHHRGRRGKLLAKASTTRGASKRGSAAASAKSGNDTVDELLRRFK
jgi:hypothetical protein